MKRLYILFLTLGMALTAIAQLPHSYSCDFEDEAENASWNLNTPRNQASEWGNFWAIGDATASLGKRSLYISSDDGATAKYIKMSESRVVIAWREVQLESGRYDLAFDWMCGGDSARSALLVAWIPEEDFDDMVCMMNDDYKSKGREWVTNNMLTFDGSELLTGGSVWTHAVNTIVSDGTSHRLVFMFVCSSATQLVQPGPCVDNIELSRNNCGAPTNMKVSMASQTASLTWQSTAEEFNLRLHRMGDNFATQVNNIKQNSFSSALKEGVYDIQIRVICEGDTSVWYNFPTAFVHEARCFDYLDLTDDRCSFSLETHSDYHKDTLIEYGRIDHGFTSMWSRHTIHYRPEEYDARTFSSIDSNGKPVAPLKTVPDGALASVRVGSWEKMARVARVEYDFTVDAKEASVLMLQYAMVLESSGHGEEQRPRLVIDIVDAETGEALSPCTTVDLASQTSGEGWYRVPDGGDGSRDVCWRDWTTLGLNLAEYDGMHVKVKITVYGCSAEIHYGYAYFTLTCTTGQLQGLQCGWTPTNEFIAPPGFNYRWYRLAMPSETLSRKDTFKVDYRDTRDYAVDVTYKSNKNCGFTLYANAIPRFPIPEATYVLEQRDCHNYITLNNTSHILTRDWTTGDTIHTSVRPEYVGWSFGGLTPEYDPTEAPWKISFQLPDEEADYKFLLLAGVGLCDSILELNVHVPELRHDSVVEQVQRCLGDMYPHYGKYYTRDTLIIDRDINAIGCDSVHVVDLRFVEAIYDTIDVTITDEQSYLFDGRELTVPGEYNGGPYISSAGCDSMVHLRLKVVVPLVMELTSVEEPCQGASSFLIETHARKGVPNAYTLQFGEGSEATGLVKQSGSMAAVADNTITVDIPTDLKPGYYPFAVLFDSEENGTYEVAGELVQHYPASFIRQRWDDVLGILNADNNGGYDFRTFRWYRNGQAIDGATEPYLYVEEKLKAGDTYSVELLVPGEERGLTTCAYVIPAAAASQAMPAATKTMQGGNMYILVNGQKYNAQGVRVK